MHQNCQSVVCAEMQLQEVQLEVVLVADAAEAAHEAAAAETLLDVGVHVSSGATSMSTAVSNPITRGQKACNISKHGQI